MSVKVALMAALGVVSLTLLAGMLLGAHEDGSGSAVLGRFRSFQETYGRAYSSLEEFEYRLAVFRKNYEMISAHNADLSQSYTMDVNQFADLTFEEFSAYYLAEEEGEGDLPRDFETARGFVPTEVTVDEVDWVKQGIVHQAKNQGRCGSCWSFAATAALESAMAQTKSMSPPTLSEQELIDCSRGYGNHGCGGGYAYQAMAYIVDHGLNNDQDYPYKAALGTCKSDISGKGWAKLPKFVVLEGGVDKLVAALTVRPVTVSFYANMTFQFYRKGIYKPSKCSGARNHAVLAVGFDLKDSIPNFYVKNSWGEKWGMNGYFRIATGTGNGTCTIAGPGRNCLPLFE